MTSSRLVIDCDPGLDDAVAIALALASPELRLEAVVTVAGNAGLDQVTRNAAAILQALGAACPVYPGHDRPRRGQLRLGTARWGGSGALDLPPAPPDAVAACDFKDLYDHGPITLAAIGPLTNIAALLAARPRASARIRRLSIMGGCFDADPQAPPEFNAWADPQAAAAVLASGIPLTLAPLDVTRRLSLPAPLVERLQAGAGRGGSLFRRLLPLFGRPGHPAALHDALAVGWLLWPELYTAERGWVTVETAAGERQGRTQIAPDPRGPHQVLRRIDGDVFLDRLAERLARLG